METMITSQTLLQNGYTILNPDERMKEGDMIEFAGDSFVKIAKNSLHITRLVDTLPKVSDDEKGLTSIRRFARAYRLKPKVK